MEHDYQYYKEAYKEHQAILEVICDQITIADKDGVFVRISDSCADNLGTSKEKIIGHSCYELEKKGIFSCSVTSAVLKAKREITLIQETKAGRRLQETEDLLEMIKQQMQQEHSVDSPLLLGTSQAMQSVLKIIKAVALLNVTILLSGETGVGKSVYARYIHNMSPQNNQPFIQINCGAVPAELIESELFGYAPGSFTGANAKGKEGLLAAAKKGTLFLDEISEMPQALQVKLLHILQERKYIRIGETTERPFKARIIAASNKDLKTLVEQGLFREDLYYRLNVIPIKIPALRERRADIPLLATHFLQLANDKYSFHKKISEQGLLKLQNYSWPGNVRELENTVERLAIVVGKNLIDAEDIRGVIPEMQFDIMPGGNEKKLKDIMESIEKEIFRRVLEEQKTTRKIAEELGIDQSTVVKKLKKYQLRE